MRARDLDALSGRIFDVLVVGGGIHGLATALAAARRGLTVALVEKADFGGSTSFNHQRTAHGGLRSLQSGRLRHARESILERRALARMAPRLLRPLPFLVGTYRSLVKNRLFLQAAFRVDRVLGRDRNEGIEPELHLPAAKLVSRAATLKLFPGVRQAGLTGGANWYDYQIVHSNRLTIAFAEGADALGARLINYAAAVTPLKEGARILGMRVREAFSGAEIDVRAKMTINAAGAHVGDVMKLFGVERDVPMLKAMNLVTSKTASDIALAAPGRDGAMLTLTPWHGRGLVGTFQSATLAQPSDLSVTPHEIEAAVASANGAFSALRLTRDDVTLVHRGIVPARDTAGGAPQLLQSWQILDHRRDGIEGALTVLGVKYTTARRVGAGAASAAANIIGAPSGARRNRDGAADAALPGAGIADHEALAIETARAAGLELAAPIIRRLIDVYGDRCAPIIRLMAEKTDWRMPLAPGQLAVGAEVIYAIRGEMAMTLADVVIRRTELGARGYPEDRIVESAAVLAAEEHGWDDQRRAVEVARVRDFYTW
jgi:glycerol-3-phosphate dehydrogenase